MTNNPHKPGATAANSFRADEIDALNELFKLLDRGADHRQVLRSQALTRARQKFLRMASRIAKAADPCP